MRTPVCSKVLVVQVIILKASLFPLGHLGDDYVPLNSLTLSSLYKDKTTSSSSSTKRPVPDKTWWTDLQEKRQEYKAKRQKLKLQLQKQPSADTGDSDIRIPPTPLKSSLLGNATCY